MERVTLTSFVSVKKEVQVESLHSAKHTIGKVPVELL